MEWNPKAVPEVVALIAMGRSRMNYIGSVMRMGHRNGVADEVWVINKLASVYQHDLVFRMDDMREPRKVNQRVCGDKDNKTAHERMDEWMRNHDKPIVTSTVYPEFPTAVAYPLEAVINTLGYSYIRTTPAYAAAFAIHIGVKHLKLYGCDYTYPEKEYRALAESGRANLEFILAIGMMKGMKVEVAKSSTLLDTCVPMEGYFYGYPGQVIEVVESKEEGKRYALKPRPDIDKKVHNQREQMEKAQLQALLTKYEPEVVRDLIKTKSITPEMIGQYFNDHPEDLGKELKDFAKKPLLDAPLGAVQDESLKGDSNHDDPSKIPKGSNECRLGKNPGSTPDTGPDVTPPIH